MSKNRDILDFMKKYGLYDRDDDHYIYLEIEDLADDLNQKTQKALDEAEESLSDIKTKLYDLYNEI